PVLAGIWGDRSHGGVFTAPSPLGPWTRIGPGLEGREVLSLAVAGSQVLAGTDDGLFLSADPAAPWRRLPTLIGGVDLHPRVTDVVALSDQVFLAASPQGILRSLDGGATWRRPSLGMWGPADSFAVSGRTLGLVLASSPLGFFKSVDGGDRWVLVSRGLGPTEAHTIAFVPSDDRMVYATSTRGLFRSKDQGATWSQVTGGIPFTDITGLAIRPDGRTLYASDFTWGGIFRSQNGGGGAIRRVGRLPHRRRPGRLQEEALPAGRDRVPPGRRRGPQQRGRHLVPRLHLLQDGGAEASVPSGQAEGRRAVHQGVPARP